MPKPLIRHCRNCEYYKETCFSYKCSIRYKSISYERLKALLCKFYEVKDDNKQ